MGVKYTTQDFIKKARETHGNKYKYDKVNYVNSKTKVVITCPIHGDWEQRPSEHIYGYGCAYCAGCAKSTTESFISMSNIVHSAKYTYTKVNYSNAHTKVTITCPHHGDFQQRPDDHLQGHGCSNCRYDNFKTTLNDFIKRANITHDNKYSYLDVCFDTLEDNIQIICPIHGKFEQNAHSHLRGRGCPSCAKNGFQPSKPAYLYYLKVTTDDDQVLYKIGITNNSVNERFSLTELAKIEIVKQKLYENGQDALDWEQYLLKKYNKYQYQGSKILVSGNTELFTEDILGMYYKENQSPS